jgi:hypothetical protein
VALDLPFPPTPENATRFAALAVDAALNVDNVCLDYSPGSLRRVEEILDRHVGDGRVMASVLVFGCYLGEVFVRAGRGRWRSTDETPMKGLAGFPLIVELGNRDYCDPLGRVRRYCESGVGESLVRFWDAFAAGRAADDPRRRTWWRRLLGR